MSRRDPGESLALLRTLVTAYERMLPVLEQMRVEVATVEELLGVAEAADTIHERLALYRKRVKQIEHSMFSRARLAAKQQEARP